MVVTLSKQDMKERTRKFALRVIKLSTALPQTAAGRVIANQLVRWGTSVGANYRAALRARSTPDFISKLGITLEEADESVYWIELIIEGGLVRAERAGDLLKEANELTAIFAASHRTTKAHSMRNAREANHKS